MAVKMRFESDDSFELFLSEIVGATEEAQELYLKEAGKKLKGNIVRNLDRLRTTGNRGSRDKAGSQYKHMADDVQARVVKDKYGGRVMRVSGGRLTGTLWHIVNDGTYRSRPTHFMDDALQQTETDLPGIVEAVMRKAGF